jgi:D-alanyl-D-alanine carboxypeptidase
MNTRVKNMGLTDTNLVNPSGWGVPNHYTSAHDLAVFTMYALQYPRFVELISTLEHDTASGGYHLRNNNRLMTLYPSLLGGKTGYDDDAGWCLIEVARRNGNTMISVTMDGIHPDDWYDDNQVLLEYAFEQKEARIAAGAAIAGEVLAFRDPDAALIAQVATAGGSLGRPPSAVGLSGPAEVASSVVEPVPGQEVAVSSEALVLGQTGMNLQFLSAFLVAAMILAGSSVFTFGQPAIRNGVGGTSSHRGRRLGWPGLNPKMPRVVRRFDRPN